MRATIALFCSIGIAAASLSFAPAAMAQAGAVEPDDLALTPLTERADVVALIALYAGDWVARGTSRTNLNDPLEAASCRMSSTYDAASETLSNDGRCANTQRALDLVGDLMVTADGGLDGGYFNGFGAAELVSSAGTGYVEGFIVEASYLAEIGREQRQIDAKVSVSRPELLDNGDTAFSMVIEIADPDTAEPVVFSQLVFTRRD